MSSSNPTERSCKGCGKTASELDTPLKQCAKCHAQSYCSRDCQKSDWKNHKKDCNAGKPAEPSKDNILAVAQSTVSLLKALSHDPNFNTDLRAIPKSHSGLMYICDFIGRTFREYLPAILPPQKYAELSADLESFHGIDRTKQLNDMSEKFEEMKKRDSLFDKDEWPTFDGEKYTDVMTRNLTAAKIILSPSQQRMMGGAYAYDDETKRVATALAG